MLARCGFVAMMAFGMVSTTAIATDDVPPFAMSLFDGKSLDGWVIENDAEVDVVDGCLRLKAGDGWLRSHHQYRDFTLSLEWKALQAKQYDAGIY
ncbi:MAG TPA: family 16 glycoside hydrolase, partial [Planctomycetaceae bacterium]|nr:family 16 glycoside hydrolase [Planctomycetaceae bacterium]